MGLLNINCNGIDTIQDTIEIDDNLADELIRAKKENRQPIFTVIKDGESTRLNR